MKLIQKFTAAAMGTSLIFSSTAAFAEARPAAHSAISASSEATTAKYERNDRRGRDGRTIRRGDRDRKHDGQRHRRGRDNDRFRDHRRHDNDRGRHDRRDRHQDRRIIIPIPIPFPAPNRDPYPYRGYNLSRQFQQCVNYTSGSAASYRAATRIVNQYPHIAPYAHAQWRLFEHQVAQGICRQELNMPRQAITAGPYTLVPPSYMLRR